MNLGIFTKLLSMNPAISKLSEESDIRKYAVNMTKPKTEVLKYKIISLYS